jgi:endonuclease/exonuclease/phosphatase family metal-dependent hydrolase
MICQAGVARMLKNIFCFLMITGCSAILAQDDGIDIGTFNIRFFPCNEDSAMMRKYDIEMRYPPTGVATDTTMLFQLIKSLDVEILGVQEIVDPPLFGAMAKRFLGPQYEFIYAPSNGWQKIGILFNSEKVMLIGEPQIYNEVALGRPDRLRPALRGYFRTIPDGFDFHVIVLHLKSGPRGYDERKEQWAAIDSILMDVPGGAEHDADIILLGDFNDVSNNRENEFLPGLNRMGYLWTAQGDSQLITEYWQPDWQKPEIEGSMIDQIVLSPDAKIEYMKNSLRVGGLCAGGKSAFEDNFPDYYLKVSDHCPLIVTFRAFPDDD